MEKNSGFTGKLNAYPTTECGVTVRKRMKRKHLSAVWTRQTGLKQPILILLGPQRERTPEMKTPALTQSGHKRGCFQCTWMGSNHQPSVP